METLNIKMSYLKINKENNYQNHIIKCKKKVCLLCIKINKILSTHYIRCFDEKCNIL